MLILLAIPIIILALCGCAVKTILFRKASGREFAAWFFYTILATCFSIFIARSDIKLFLFPTITLVICGFCGFAWLKPAKKQSDDMATSPQKEADDLCLNRQMQNGVKKRKLGKTELRVFLSILRVPFAIIISFFIIVFSLLLSHWLMLLGAYCAEQ